MSLYHDVFFKLPRPAWGTAQPRGMEMAPEICYGHWAVAPGGQNTGILFFQVTDVELQVELYSETDYIFGAIRLGRPRHAGAHWQGAGGPARGIHATVLPGRGST